MWSFVVASVLLSVVVLVIFRIASAGDSKTAIMSTLSIIVLVMFFGLFQDDIADIREEILNIMSFIVGALVGALTSTWVDK